VSARGDRILTRRGGTSGKKGPILLNAGNELRHAAFRVCQDVRALEEAVAEAALGRAPVSAATWDDLRDASARITAVLDAAPSPEPKGGGG